MDYAAAGVDIEKGDDASSILFEAAQKTFENRNGKLGEQILAAEGFAGLRCVDIASLPEGTVMGMNFDGVGTKVEIAQRMNKHDTLAFDLLAMVCDDAVMKGGEAALVGTILDTKKVDIAVVKQLAEGYVTAAKQAGVAVVNGELAELGDAIGGYTDSAYNWGAGLVWFGKKEKMFTGKEIQEGDSIVALREKGFRSNGLSLVRKAFEKRYGTLWHAISYNEQTLGEQVLTPSTIYAKAVIALHNETDCIHGVAHITGGGIPGKLGRVLSATPFGAELTSLFAPCAAMKHCQEVASIDDEEAYKTWNMGNGMLIITNDPDNVVAHMQKMGIDAQVAGKIITEKKIVIHSKGNEGKILEVKHG